MYITLLWNEMPCNLTNTPLFLRSLVLLWPGSLLAFRRPQFIESDDGCSLLLWNISKRMPDYMTLRSKRRRSSCRSVHGFVLELWVQVIKQRHEAVWILKRDAVYSGNIYQYLLKPSCEFPLSMFPSVSFEMQVQSARNDIMMCLLLPRT